MPTVASRRPASSIAARRIQPAGAALGVLLLAAGLLLLYAGRHLTFFYDEWAFVFTRRGGSINSYLDPHNGHLVLFPVIVYKVLFSIFGLRHYTPYRIVGIGLHLLCGALLYVLVARRLGPWLGLVPAALLLFMGTAWQDLLWPFQMGYLASVAGGLGAFVALERQDTWGDAVASALLIVAIGSSGVGIPFLVACAVAVIAQRGSWRRLWVIALPALIYAIWYVGWGSGESVTSDAVLAAPQYVASAAAGTVDGIAGLDPSWGPPLAVALVAAMVVSWQRRRGRVVTPVLLASVAGALTFWTLAALTRADSADPTASRYLYVGAVFVILAAAESGLGVALRPEWLAPVGILVVAAVIGNLQMLRMGERSLRASDDAVRAALTSVEVAAPVVSPAFLPDSVNGPQITAGSYLAAVHDLGSPALSLTELQRAPESVRVKADSVLEHAEALAVATATKPEAALRPCQRFEPTATVAYVDVDVVPGGQVLVRATPFSPVLVYLRRFASQFAGAPFASIPTATNSLIRFPVDRAGRLPWRVRLTASRPFGLCPR
jgi:hypothetical protein